MLGNRLQRLLNYLRHRITNAASKGMNSLVARIIANARGLRTFIAFAPGFCSSWANSVPPLIEIKTTEFHGKSIIFWVPLQMSHPF